MSGLGPLHYIKLPEEVQKAISSVPNGLAHDHEAAVAKLAEANQSGATEQTEELGANIPDSFKVKP